MVLSPNINDREKDKFAEDANGDTCVRVCGETSISGGRAVGSDYQSLSINDTTWTEITNISDILVVSVQNNTGFQVKLRKDDGGAGYVGMPLASGRERNYNDLDTGFTLYAKAESGAGTVALDVEYLLNA